MPPLTVIINVYNGETTLAETIDSALAQTFSDFELLIWDDCSSDGCAAIVRRYKNPRIRYFRSDEQLSLGRARQCAIEMAKGEWVAFLDQDDLWLPRKLELQLARAREHPDAAMIYGRTVRFYPNGRQRDYDQAHEYALLPEGDIFGELFRHSCFIAMSSSMFRRSAITNIGGIPAWIQIIPDYYLYIAVARRFSAAAVQQVVCRYRMHPHSASASHTVAIHNEALAVMEMWRDAVHPAILAKCKRHHSTQVALAEMRSPGGVSAGLVRLIREGSPTSQVVRPFWFFFHLVRRNILPPYWKTVRR